MMKIGKYKISLLNSLRLVAQILCFILLPGLYISTFSGIKQIYLSIIHQSFSIDALFPHLIEIIAIIPVTILMGRFFCGWMCAFGSLSDFIYHISSKVFKVKFKINEKVDSVLKYIKYIVLSFLIIVVWTFGSTRFSTSNPWDVFGILATFGKAPDFAYVISELAPGFLIFVMIVIASFFVERFFCRYLCPMGAILLIASKLRFAKVRKSSDKCGNCRICTKSCAMGIPLYKDNIVESGECINCFKCVSACPHKNVSLSVDGDDIRPAIAGTMAALIMAGIYSTGSFIVKKMEANNSVISAAGTLQDTNSTNLYEDGTYEGSGTGFRGATTTVSVTIQNDKITDIKVLSHGDDKPFFDRAYSTVVNEILSTQSTDVDAVSGATFSSNGIMEAVANALSKAEVSTDSAMARYNSQLNQAETNSSELTDDESMSASPETTQETKPDTLFEVASDKSSNELPDTLTKAAPDKSSYKLPDSSDDVVQSTPSEAASAYNQDTDSSSSVETENSTTAYQYKNGTYEGSGIGFRGAETIVSVTVENDKITDIQIVSYGDDRPFFNRAYPTIISEILDTQSTRVDAVSGATFSSNGIMEAVADALSKASVD